MWRGTAASVAAASGYQGQVPFNGFAIPGATVTATQDDKKFVAVSNQYRHCQPIMCLNERHPQI